MSIALRRPPIRRPRPRTFRRLQPRIAVVALAAAGLLGVTATAAAAHVTVKPDVTASGGYAELVFRVPNETPSATTTKIVLTLPQTTPFKEVSVEPVPGWDVSVTDAPLPSPATVDGTTITTAPHVVTWTATSTSGIAPGQYQSFAISAGPLPAPGMLVLPVDQTYSDGSVVTWADPPTEGGAEPEHPAPHFEVTAASADGDHHASAASESGAAAAAGSSETPGSADSETPGSADAAARWLSGAALLVALGSVALQVAGRPRHTG